MRARIAHIGVYTTDLERLKDFYVKYFAAVCDEHYDSNHGFKSYFLSLGNDVRLEVMSHTMLEHRDVKELENGLSHLAFSVGTREEVSALTNRLQNDGYMVISAPRETGDGYFESKVLDPDGNCLEITI